MKPDLGKLLGVLIEKEIDFVLIGGFAGILHGTSMVTEDLDICALLTKETVTKLRASRQKETQELIINSRCHMHNPELLFIC